MIPKLTITQGNRKLGLQDIWGMGLPALHTCPGATVTCEAECNMLHIEKVRPSMLATYLENLAASKRPDFVRRVLAYVLAHAITVLRVHVSGDFYSVAYARKWLKIARKAKHVILYWYTRSWRVPAIRRMLVQMSRLKNVRQWWSLDKDSGVPTKVPRRVRLCYLQVAHDDLPPPEVKLVFRVRRLRKRLTKKIGLSLVCPPENGVKTKVPIHCEKCTVCFDGRTHAS